MKSLEPIRVHATLGKAGIDAPFLAEDVDRELRRFGLVGGEANPESPTGTSNPQFALYTGRIRLDSSKYGSF